MDLLEIKNVSKIYETDKKKTYVLYHVNLSFSNSGLVSIVGKSGSGKSTLINMLSLIDKPSEGSCFFNGENIGKYNAKKVNQYRNKYVGIVSQSYNLLEEETCLYNVMLPMLISGYKKSRAEEDATDALKAIDFPERLYNQKVKDLSGGEKERISILRAVINDPKIIFADEPTGALDSKNSISALELLKKISKKKLVIMVSHNQNLVEKYSDRIITIKDGEVISDNIINSLNNGVPLVKTKNKKSSIWTRQILKTNFLKRFKRNVLVCASLIVGIVSTLLITGFSTNAKGAINETMKQHLDFGSMTLTKERVVEKSENGLKIVQSERPKIDDLIAERSSLEDLYVGPNYDFFLASSNIYYQESKINDIATVPVYSFNPNHIDYSLLLMGKIPSENAFNYCLINTQCFEKIKSLGFNVGDEIVVNSNFTYSFTEDGSSVEETFNLEKKIKIVGVVNELDFLSSPKIYYSYLGFDNLMNSIVCDNSSKYYDRKITWKDIVELSQPHDKINSFSYRVFKENIQNGNKEISFSNNSLVLTSNSKIINDALSEIVDACTIGMWVFISIAIIGTILILGIASYASYAEDRKKNAILLMLGASSDDIASIYYSESLILGISSLLIGTIFSLVLEPIANKIILVTTGFDSLVKIPWIKFMGFTGLFPLLLFLAIIIVSVLASAVPIAFGNIISLKEELSAE